MGRTNARRNTVIRLLGLAITLAFSLTITTATPAASEGNEGVAGAPRAAQSQIAAGSAHTCIIQVTTEVWCWGSNDYGQLGTGGYTGSTKPIKVPGLTGVTAIAAGRFFTCALLSNGTVRCWGESNEGQIGNGGYGLFPSPVQVAGISGATAVGAGSWHACALVGGSPRCWGSNSYGQLGNGTYGGSPVPVPVNLPGATALSLGVSHTCALVNNGTVQCWGDNYFGQLGNPGYGTTPFPVPVHNLTGATTVSSGLFHSCSIAGGVARCWGYGTPGVQAPLTGSSGASALASGGYHRCGLFAGGTVRCQGRGDQGQLGNGTFGDSGTLVAVSNLSGATAVTAGDAHTCALIGTGNVRCWGQNAFGQLGNGTVNNTAAPVVALMPPSAPTGVSATPGYASASVAFTPSSNNGSPITSYKVVASPGGATATGSASPITVTGLANGTAYTFTVTATSAAGTSPPSAPSNAVTPGALPFYSVNDVSITEGNTSSKLVTFTVTRAGNTSAASSVKFATANGTAVAPGDYTAKAATALYFSAGQTSKAVTVSIRGDVVVEPNETLSLVLSAPVSSSIFDGTGVATIVNDDSNAAPTFAINDLSVTEGNASTKVATFTVTRSGSTAAAASVKFATANGTAVAPGDYTARALTGLSFAIGQTTAAVAVTIRGELTVESNETFTVNLSAPVGATIADGTGVGTIVNDDSNAPATFSVNDVSIVEGASFTKTLTFTITRTGSLAASSSVKHATANGTAVAPGDYTARALTTVTFAVGQSTATVAVTIRGDVIVEPNETFSLVLSSPVGAVIGDATGTGTIVDDD